MRKCKKSITFAPKSDFLIKNTMRTSTVQQKVGHVPYGGVYSTPTISLAELNEKSISVEESEQLLTQQIHEFYRNRA